MPFGNAFLSDAALQHFRLRMQRFHRRAFTDKCVVGIEVNEARCRDLLELNPSIATALNPYIGYDKASEVAKASAKEHKSVREIVLREGLLPEDDIDDALDVRAMTKPGLPG